MFLWLPPRAGALEEMDDLLRLEVVERPLTEQEADHHQPLPYLCRLTLAISSLLPQLFCNRSIFREYTECVLKMLKMSLRSRMLKVMKRSAKSWKLISFPRVIEPDLSDFMDDSSSMIGSEVINELKLRVGGMTRERL